MAFFFQLKQHAQTADKRSRPPQSLAFSVAGSADKGLASNLNDGTLMLWVGRISPDISETICALVGRCVSLGGGAFHGPGGS